MSDYKIHIAYGFHVNCYHSYRGDSNDNLGFGSDIRIIRKTIDVLNKLNEQGIPVKGTWDIENFFSLEQILPKYAPDIIDSIRLRCEKYGDENIIMGYNNGALSAMTPDELEASVDWSVTNSHKSGLQDVFGSCRKIVRPQEVMFTPSQVSLYNQLGVEALCLYYSAVPFDAFRTIVPRLDDEEAFNPLTYSYGGESMTVLPTYSNSDVCDAGCLRAWVKDLRAKQESGQINSDLFIFINMDADAIFWETLDLPIIKGKLANTDGIHGLVSEVADLDYIVFDTPGGYLDNHKAIGHIDFTQDTADGNFTGYGSWSEKPFNRTVWTRLERARAMARLSERDNLSPSFDGRVLLLSTTHFGLATPVLNIEREKKALALSESTVKSEIDSLKKVKKLTVFNINNSDFQCLQLKKNGNFCAENLVVKSKYLDDFAAVDTGDDSLYLMLKFNKVQPSYELDVSLKDSKKVTSTLPLLRLETKAVSMDFSVHGNIYSVKSFGKEVGNQSFLQSFITYDDKRYDFENVSITALKCGGSAQGVRVTAVADLPSEIAGGVRITDFFTVPFSDAVFVRCKVNYPYTAEQDSISTENSSLGRFTDMKWQEAVPFELTPALDGDIRVIKRNFMDDVSAFRTSSFKECDAKNTHLDSFNHQLTAGMVGLCGDNGGLICANSRQVLCSMAHCPMRIDEDGTVHMAMFGTYFGSQRHHWSRSHDEALAAYNLVTPQARSIAPSYNGNSETSVMGLYFFGDDYPDDNVLNEIKSFADGAVCNADSDNLLLPFDDDNVVIKDVSENKIDEKDLKSPIASGSRLGLLKYITVGSRAIGNIIIKQIKSKK